MKHIFCIFGKSGSGKTTYFNKIFENLDFLKESKLTLNPLVIYTTRKKRENEINGVDYFFVDNKECGSISSKTMIDYRVYCKFDEGTVYYFTLENCFEKFKNYLCIGSPQQYINYYNFVQKENENEEKYKLHPIYINTSVENRIVRSLKRCETDNNRYEVCRRVLYEMSEFEIYYENKKEIYDDILIIDNNDDNDFENNYLKIKTYILFKMKES